MAKTQPLLTSFEAGLLIGRSSRTIQRMVDAGKLKPAQKLAGPNGAYLFARADIEKLVPRVEEAASA